MKHPNHSYEIESRSHLLLQPGKLLSLGLQSTAYETCRHKVYSSMLECIQKTYEALSLLNCNYYSHISSDYNPKCVIANYGSQLFSPMRKRTPSNYNIYVKFLPVHNTYSNPSERKMQEISNFFRIIANHTEEMTWVNSLNCEVASPWADQLDITPLILCLARLGSTRVRLWKENPWTKTKKRKPWRRAASHVWKY